MLYLIFFFIVSPVFVTIFYQFKILGKLIFQLFITPNFVFNVGCSIYKVKFKGFPFFLNEENDLFIYLF